MQNFCKKHVRMRKIWYNNSNQPFTRGYGVPRGGKRMAICESGNTGPQAETPH